MEKLDFTKRDKALYLPGTAPEVVTVGPMTFLTVDGSGNPNDPEGAYQAALGLLYALAYTIKMSPKNGMALPGYVEFAVPPLEGLWWMEGAAAGVDYAHKERFCWKAMLRQPDFVTPEVFDWAKAEVLRKKKLDASPARLETLDEGLCVQCMHLGPFDAEPETVARLHAFIAENGLAEDHSAVRRHHEIYLKDARRTAPEKLKTVLRLPVRRT